MRKSIVMVRPDIDAALNWKRDKLMPTVEATPCMAGLLADARKKDARSTTQNHRFPGGSLKLLGANSPSGFRSSSASVVLQDEVDAYRTNVEGDPCALGDRSAITFSDAWLIKSSTTTLEGQSRISTGYESGDKRKYFLPCLHCGVFQHLLTEQMKFTFAPEEHVRFDPPPPLLKLGEKRKIAVRVVSMPSSTTFDRQPVAYKTEVLPAGLPRIAVEMGVTQGWWKYGCAAVLGIDTYGESAPAPVLFEHFGFTPANLAQTVQAVLRK